MFDHNKLDEILSEQLHLVIYLDRSLDLKTELTIPQEANIGTIKRLLAESDPTGSTDPLSFTLRLPLDAGARKLTDCELVPEGLTELEISPLPPSRNRSLRKPMRCSAIPDSVWSADCEAGFERAYPPSWEFQERIRGMSSGWTPFPAAVSSEINAVARRGQRRGTIKTDACGELTIDLQDMVVIPVRNQVCPPRPLRKVSSQVRADKKMLKQLYIQYAQELPSGDHSEGSDGIFGESLLDFFEDLGVDPAADVAALALSSACGAAEMGVLCRREFIRGCATLDVDSLEDLRGRMPTLREDVMSGKVLHEVYAYTFGIALEPPSKVLPVDEARQYWTILLHGWTLRASFCSWAEAHIRAVNRDLWMMVLKFATQVPPDLSTYDDDPAWPVVLDEFVEYQRALQRGG